MDIKTKEQLNLIYKWVCYKQYVEAERGSEGLWLSGFTNGFALACDQMGIEYDWDSGHMRERGRELYRQGVKSNGTGKLIIEAKSYLDYTDTVL